MAGRHRRRGVPDRVRGLLITDQLHWVSSFVADVLRDIGLGRLTVS